MSPLGIVLVSLLGVYVVMSAVDRFWYQPKVVNRNLPKVNERLDALEKRLTDLETK